MENVFIRDIKMIAYVSEYTIRILYLLNLLFYDFYAKNCKYLSCYVDNRPMKLKVKWRILEHWADTRVYNIIFERFFTTYYSRVVKFKCFDGSKKSRNYGEKIFSRGHAHHSYCRSKIQWRGKIYNICISIFPLLMTMERME